MRSRDTLLVSIVIGALVLSFGYWLTTTGLKPFKPDDTIAGIAIAVATPIIAVLAGVAAYSSFLVNLSSARSTRFQKGAEMLADKNESVRSAGIFMLRSLAREDPKGFAGPVVKTLALFVTERNPLRGTYHPFYGVPKVPDELRLQRGDASAVEAFEAAATAVPSDRKWKDCQEVAVDGRVMVPEAFFSGHMFNGVDLSKMDFYQGVLNQTAFDHCNMSDCLLTFVAFGGVIFDHCDLRNSTIVVHHPSGAKAQGPLDLRILRIDGGAWGGATINGIPISDWVAAAKDAAPTHLRGTKIDLLFGAEPTSIT